MIEQLFHLGGAALIAVVVSAVLWMRPKALVGVTLVVILFVRTATHLTGMSVGGNADDALTVLVVVRALFESKPDHRMGRFPGGLWFLLFGVVGVVGGIVSAYPSLPVTASGAFLATKGMLLGWAIAQLAWTPHDVRHVFAIGSGVVVVVLLSVLMNAAAPGLWASVFSVGGTTIDRYGLPSMTGLFIHPFDLAFFSAMAAVAVFAYRRVFGTSRFTTGLLIGTSLATVASFRRKDLLGLIAALFTLGGFTRRIRGLVVAITLVPVIAIAAWDEISLQVADLLGSYFSPDSNEARTVLTLNALRLATDYAPLGAGFGRFGSRTAAIEYSPEYYRLGINDSFGLGPGDQGFFLTDTSWPAIVGETGFLGTALFVLAFCVATRRVLVWARSDEPALRLIGLTVMGWLILTLFQSTGAAVFTSPPMYGFVFAGLGIGAALEGRTASEPAFPQRGVARVAH